MIELWQFNFSMYPEIVRWALDHKDLAYRVHNLLPGPHVAQLLRFGQKTVPVLRDGERVLKDSLAIVEDLEARHPGHPLLPEEPAAREAAWTIAHRFARDVGPWVRLAAFHDLLEHGRYMARVWSQPFSGAVRAAYVAAFPLLVRPVMRMDMCITAARAREGRRRTAEALDWVANRSQCGPYLVGDRFTLADLVAASTLYLTDLSPEYPVQLPQPWPDGLLRWRERWHGHPGAAWVHRIYARHRMPPSRPQAG